MRCLRKRKIASHKSLYGIMMDVNDFKCINDNLGHSTGDKAICTLGKYTHQIHTG